MQGNLSILYDRLLIVISLIYLSIYIQELLQACQSNNSQYDYLESSWYRRHRRTTGPLPPTADDDEDQCGGNEDDGEINSRLHQVRVAQQRLIDDKPKSLDVEPLESYFFGGLCMFQGEEE